MKAITLFAVPLLGAIIRLTISSVSAFGPQTESEKKSARYFKCVVAIEDSDVNNDDKISREEFQPFVHQLATSLFGGDSPITDDTLPQELQQLYDPLVVASGVKDDSRVGVREINVYGANMFATGEQNSRLHNICETTMKAIYKLGPQTDAPGDFIKVKPQLDLAAFYTEAEEEEEEEEDMENTAMASGAKQGMHPIDIHASFIVSNLQGLNSSYIDLSHNGTLYQSFERFVKTMMEYVCPDEAVCNDDHQDLTVDMDDDNLAFVDGDVHSNNFDPLMEVEQSNSLDDDDGNATRSEIHEGVEEKDHDKEGNEDLHRHLAVIADRRRLCGPPFQHVRRMLCGGWPSHSRYLKSKKKKNVLTDLELYDIHDTECSVTCQVVYVHFDLFVPYDSFEDKVAIEQMYTEMTKEAINHGSLQEALRGLEEDLGEKAYFKVEGAGRNKYPLENVHEGIIGKGHKKGELKNAHVAEEEQQQQEQQQQQQEQEQQQEDRSNGGGGRRKLRSKAP